MAEDTTPSPSDEDKDSASPATEAEATTTPSTPTSNPNTQPAQQTTHKQIKAPKTAHDLATEPALERWQLVWDVVIFQGKLLLDGGRDLLLSPLSIIIALYALISGSQTPGRQFYDLMHLGHRTDKWINLFGAAKRIPPSEFSEKFLNSFGDENAEDRNVDNLVSQMEELVKRRYEKGGITATAKTNIDKAFDKLHAKIHHGRKKT